jgi:hypothetical protein
VNVNIGLFDAGEDHAELLKPSGNRIKAAPNQRTATHGSFPNNLGGSRFTLIVGRAPIALVYLLEEFPNLTAKWRRLLDVD